MHKEIATFNLQKMHPNYYTNKSLREV
jgi:hypothetical protein